MIIRIPLDNRLFFFIVIVIGVALATTMTTIDFTKGATSNTSTTIMNASISFAIAITPSDRLIDGISFGSVSMNTKNNNATYNNDSARQTITDSEPFFNATGYNITVDSSTSTYVDFYNAAQYGWLNNSADDRIEITNVSIEANDTVTDANLNMSINVEQSGILLNTTFLAIGSNDTCTNQGCSAGPCNYTAHDGNGYCAMMYWLDVPDDQPSGNYNTTYCYCAVEWTKGNSACSC